MQQDAGASKEFLEYAASMLQQLRDLARTNEHQMLAYLIDMASIQAAEELAKAGPSIKAVPSIKAK